MKKLRLKALSLGAREILSRDQLRSINGGCTQGSECESNICDSTGRCVGGGSDTGSPTCFASSGEQGTCPDGTFVCNCGIASLGCLPVFECEHTECHPCAG